MQTQRSPRTGLAVSRIAQGRRRIGGCGDRAPVSAGIIGRRLQTTRHDQPAGVAAVRGKNER